MLAANSRCPLREALVVLLTTPAVLSGVVLALWITGTTLNVQSMMGAIMAIGVSVANAVLLVTFARDRWHAGVSQAGAIGAAARSRLRPILMTSVAMIAGMVPTALALGEGAEQSAPLGRAVIGGLLALDRGDARLRSGPLRDRRKTGSGPLAFARSRRSPGRP